MRVRLLKPGDEKALILAARLFNEIDVTPAKAASLLSDPTFLMAIAEGENGEQLSRVYGHVLNRLDQSDLFLYEVDTLEAHQRKGAASAIIAFLRALCIERGYGEMFVPTECENEAGNGLYRAAGGVLEGSPANIYVFFTPQK